MNKIFYVKINPFLKENLHLVLLFCIALLSFFLNFYNISQNGYGNEYYAAAIKSMSLNFHNFFYISSDPAGLVSVDKPPIALWIQTIFVLAFGYHGWAMILPQALAATGSSIMMYIIVSRYFGHKSGLISALIFAITPAVVVAARNNTMDTQLIFALLIATYFFFRAIEETKRKYLIICALIIGIAFNIKMLQAYMILPAIVIVYFIFAKEKIFKRIINSLISLIIILIVSFSWAIIVELTPKDSRPYIGSSTNNSVFELIIGHNGLERIYGKNSNNSTNEKVLNNNKEFNNSNKDFLENNKQINGNGQGNEIGSSGIFRLWTNSIYGQASWLIILAVFCILVKIGKFKLKNLTIQQGVFLYWIIWLAIMYVFFSFAEFWHRYYLCMLAPAIAGIIGPGIIEMYKYFKDNNNIKKFLLPIALIVTIISEIIYVWNYTELRNWLIPIMMITAVFSLLFITLNYMSKKRMELVIGIVLMILSVSEAPFYWAFTTVIYQCTNTTMPYAGPELNSKESSNYGTNFTQNNQTSISTSLEKYLVKNYKEGSYLVVANRSNDVAQFIIDTGLPAVAYGGFLGSDNAITLKELKELVKEGKITYFLTSNNDGMGGNSNSDIESYVKNNATLINQSEYGGNNIISNGGRMVLYLFEQ